MAQRILGMGDVMTLVEKAERQMDERQAQELERKIRKEQFTLDDFLDQLQQIRKMGPLQSLLKMMPGVGQQLGNVNLDERELDRAPGDHPVDDAGGAGQPEDHRRLAPQADRARLRHERAGGQPAGQAVRPDEETDAPAVARKDARPAATGRRPVVGQAPGSAGCAAFALALPLLMSVRVRLTRVGNKKNPIWRVVVSDQRSPRDGRFIETIGH